MALEQTVASEVAAGRYGAALGLLEKALAENPGRYDLLCLLGYVHQNFGHYAEACDSYEKALILSPPSFELRHNLGLVYRELDRLEQARENFQAALVIRPNALEALQALSSVLQMQGDLNGSLALFEKILKIDPRHVPTHVAMAETFADHGWEQEAIRSYRVALEIDKNNLPAMNGLGAMCLQVGAYDEARRLFKQALANCPESVDLRRNLALVALARRDVVEAEAHCLQALQNRPDDPDVHFTLGTVRLISGRLREGWPDYEYRWQSAEKATVVRTIDSALPRWQGETVNADESGLVLYGEQGFGDSIQFSRFVPLVARRFNKICLQVQEPLRTLFERSFGHFAEVRSVAPDETGYTHHCPLMSLPLAFDTSLETIPSDVPYLTPDPARVGFWQERLAGPEGLKVGVVWATGKRAVHKPEFDVPLQFFTPLFAMPGVRWVSLNKAPLDEVQKEVLKSSAVLDWTDELASFDDTAALVANLDLVVSVDTATAHLAGALGRPVWLLNRAASEWRWLLERSDSPWYPSMRIFRQQVARQWAHVVDEVIATLHEFMEGRA